MLALATWFASFGFPIKVKCMLYIACRCDDFYSNIYEVYAQERAHGKRGNIMKTAILTDSGSAMNLEQAQKHGLFLVPLQVIDGDKTYQDGVDITTSALYAALREAHTPKTSMPVLKVIQDTIRTIKQQGFDEIVAVPLSSGLSGTWNSMLMCAKELDVPLTLIENYTTCDLQGYIAIATKHLADQGKSANEIKHLMEQRVAHSGTLILPNDIQHLKRGGRLTPIAAAAASLLKIKPILRIDPSTKGKIDVFDKVRTERKAICTAVAYITQQMQGKAGQIFVIHSDNLEKAEMIKKELLVKNPQVSITINFISAVIAAHTGLDCIAIQYIEAS